jgi:hypothetical protein
MFVHVSQKDSGNWHVIDQNTGQELRGVQWVNDETGFYEAFVLNKEGSIQYCKCNKCGDEHALTITKQGNIKLIKGAPSDA